MKRVAIWNKSDYQHYIYDAIARRYTLALNPKDVAVLEYDHSTSCLSTEHHDLKEAEETGYIEYWVLD